MDESNDLNKLICPNCNTKVEQMPRKSFDYIYYMCPNCKKTFRTPKKGKKDTILSSKVDRLQKIISLLSIVVFILVFLVIFLLLIILYLIL